MADPRPANPTEDMSPAQQEQRWDEIQRWVARDEQRRLVREGIIPDPEAVKRQMAEQEQAIASQRRYNLIAAQDGFNDEIGNQMAHMAQSDPYWAQALDTDEGALQFFNVVKQQAELNALKAKAAELEAASVKRKASASKRVTTKPSVKKAAPKSAADNFAALSFDEKIEAIANDVIINGNLD